MFAPHNAMTTELPSLITADAKAGLILADQLADQLQTQIAKANESIERPGGMTFLLPLTVPRETIASVMFYTIAAANHGWESS
jgi:hypothetical protein